MKDNGFYQKFHSGNGWLLFAAYIFIFVMMSMHNIGLPWQWGHSGYVGAEKGEFAFNYLKLGYWNTRLAQMYSVGILETGKEIYQPYFHHPPLMALYISVLFLVFGVSEAIARLGSLVLCVLTLAVSFVMFSRFFEKRIAVGLGLIVTLSPINYLLRHFAGMELLAVLFITLTIFFYIRWMETRRDAWLFVTLASVFVGTFTDWQFYFFVPALATHYLVFLRQSHSKKFLIIIFLPIASFGLYMLHVVLVGGDIQGGTHFGGTMIDTLLFRLNLSESSKQYGITYSGILSSLPVRINHYFTLPVLVLTCVWVVHVICKMWKKREVRYESLFLLTAFFQVLFFLVFTNTYWIHDFLVMFLYPFIYFGIGFLFQDLLSYALLRKRLIGNAVLLCTGAVVLIFSGMGIKKIERENTHVLTIIRFLKDNPGKNLIVTFDEHLQNFQFKFYAHSRRIKRARSIDELADLIHDNLYHFIIIKPRQVKLRNFLRSRYVPQSKGDYLVFDTNLR